ncbi:MAG: hypothetical protein OXQ29_00350 [Rhodospirillaceae bacterium]|nr:hypothetical protein [Rhodospirillaceae bacterium]
MNKHLALRILTSLADGRDPQMGFDDPDYERDKEETHARMIRIGRLFRMEGRRFRSAGNDLRRQRERIAADIERDLLRRWKGT